MLVDLRDRILGQGRIPELPASWYAESALRSAGGTPFAGDFIVTARPEGGDRFEVAVVDVSGKGEGAGTRALLMSGALGGLLGALPGRAVPARRQRLPAPAELGGGVRDRDPPLRRPRHRRLRAAQRRAPAGGPARRRVRSLAVHGPDGPALGLLPQVAFERVCGPPPARRHDGALHRRAGRGARSRHRSRHRPAARPRRAPPARRRRGRRPPARRHRRITRTTTARCSSSTAAETPNRSCGGSNRQSWPDRAVTASRPGPTVALRVTDREAR